MKYLSIKVFLVFCCATAFASDPKLSPFLEKSSLHDTVCKVWVFFEDKECKLASDMVTRRGLARRTTAGYQADYSDCPVNQQYITAIEKMGGVLQNVNKWENSASFKVHSSSFPGISGLKFVKMITPVRIFKRKDMLDSKLTKIVQSDKSSYQTRKKHLDMMKIIEAHYYLRKRKNKIIPGEGVFIGYFDSGFRFDHQCFSYLKDNNKIKVARDFVDGDDDPQDSDLSGNHGSVVLAQTAGYDPGKFIGVAWGADVALARTEISDRETHTEEDNWIAALVWAESLGVDIISSSLGYIDTFEDSVLVDGKYAVNYPYSFFDGNTIMISRAARKAAERGMIIVNAIGNEGSDSFGTLCAPADADGVIAVGSVNSDTTISEFSSTGPTADGRIKPDCVAPGCRVIVPGFSSVLQPYFLQYGGTSFSTPLVSGIMAMIIQAKGKSYSADDIKNIFFKHCKFIPEQDTIDNRAGRGIPDALMSIIDSNEIFIEVVDSSEVPIVDASLLSSTGKPIANTDGSGVALLNDIKIPAEILVAVPGDTARVSLTNTPVFRKLVMNSKVKLTVQIRDTESKPVSRCKVSFDVGSGVFMSDIPDSAGNVALCYGKESLVKISVSSQDYYSPDPIFVNLSNGDNRVAVILVKIPSDNFVVYPNVFKRSEQQFVKAIFSHAKKGYKSENIQALIFAVDGSLVWNTSQMSQPGQPAKFEWTGKNNGKPVTPGIYHFIIKFKKEIYRQKFLIAE